MKKLHKSISLILAFTLCLFTLVFATSTVFAETTTATEEKVSETLLNKFETAKSTTTTALVWLSDIDTSAAETTALAAVGLSKAELAAAEAEGSTFTLTSSTSTIDADLVQSYIEAKRVASAELYLAHNQKIADEVLNELNILYISQYSPVVIVELDQADSMSIAQSNSVRLIDYYDNTVYDNTVSDSDTTVTPLTTANTITGATTINLTYGYTGNGVKIGMFETFIASPSLFPNITIAGTNGEESSNNTHAENVLEIVSSIAPDATYYLASIGTTDTVGVLQQIEWLISQGVNVINASCQIGSDDCNSYQSIARWLDHIAYEHDVHFVQSAGNYGSYGVVSGAMAYNVITVGNLYVKNSTDYTNHEIWFESSYYGEDDGLAYKPDLCAPGQGITTRFSPNDTPQYFFGTSAAAPHVTGAVALLCEGNTFLKQRQDTVKAILTASVNFESQHKYVPSQATYRYYGAGLLDTEGACLVAENGRYVGSNIPLGTTVKNHTFTVTSTNTRVRVSLAYLMNSTKIDDYSYPYATIAGLSNLDLTIYAPNGQPVGYSQTTNNNVEIVEFVTTMTGTYTVRITSNGENIVYYGLAWRL